MSFTARPAYPSCAVRYLSRNFVDESFYDAMRVFAEVVGAQERCEAVLSFIDECKQDLNDRTKDIPDSDKQKVYTGAVTFSGPPRLWRHLCALRAVHGRERAQRCR